MGLNFIWVFTSALITKTVFREDGNVCVCVFVFVLLQTHSIMLHNGSRRDLTRVFVAVIIVHICGFLFFL